MANSELDRLNKNPNPNSRKKNQNENDEEYEAENELDIRIFRIQHQRSKNSFRQNKTKQIEWVPGGERSVRKDWAITEENKLIGVGAVLFPKHLSFLGNFVRELANQSKQRTEQQIEEKIK